MEHNRIEQMGDGFYVKIPDEVVTELKLKDGSPVRMEIDKKDSVILIQPSENLTAYQKLIGIYPNEERVAFTWDRIPEEEPPL